MSRWKSGFSLISLSPVPLCHIDHPPSALGGRLALNLAPSFYNYILSSWQFSHSKIFQSTSFVRFHIEIVVHKLSYSLFARTIQEEIIQEKFIKKIT